VNAGAAASIHARLLTLAKSRSEDFNFTLNRYALERYLYHRLDAPSLEEVVAEVRTFLEAPLESLGERLLRAGIAPRHVRRYLAELREYLDEA
jgi:hypothetical protein